MLKIIYKFYYKLFNYPNKKNKTIKRFNKFYAKLILIKILATYSSKTLLYLNNKWKNN